MNTSTSRRIAQGFKLAGIAAALMTASAVTFADENGCPAPGQDARQSVTDPSAGTASDVVVIVVPPTRADLLAADDSEDGTARRYDRGYYKDPETVAVFVSDLAETAGDQEYLAANDNAEPQFIVIVVPSGGDDVLAARSETDDGTAQQFDRGYYKEPETVAVLITDVEQLAFAD